MRLTKLSKTLLLGANICFFGEGLLGPLLTVKNLTYESGMMYPWQGKITRLPDGHHLF
jgi:hypothetical protein